MVFQQISVPGSVCLIFTGSVILGTGDFVAIELSHDYIMHHI